MPIANHRVHGVRDIAAYLLDRADQYENDSPCWTALTDAAQNVMLGEISRAKRENEFGADLYARVDSLCSGVPRDVDPKLGTENRPWDESWTVGKVDK